MKKTYKELLDELVEWEVHEIMEQNSLKELKALNKKFESHREKLIKALKEKEKLGEM